MIYSYTPEWQKKRGMALTLPCFFVGALLLIPTGTPGLFTNILGSLAPVCFLFGLIATDRFLLTSYTYVLERDDLSGEVLFRVTERHGKRLRVVCRIAVHEVYDIKDASGGEDTYKMPKGMTKYSYCPPLSKKERIALLISDGDGECAVFISADERLRGLLLSFSSYGKYER